MEMPTREELIQLCEDAVRPEKVWSNRDSASAHVQLGQAWVLLKAGCSYHVHTRGRLAPDPDTWWVSLEWKGFSYFEYGAPTDTDDDTFYIPTRERLERVGDEDWYC